MDVGSMIVPGTLVRPRSAGSWVFSGPPGGYVDSRFVDVHECIALCIADLMPMRGSARVLIVFIPALPDFSFAYSYHDSWIEVG